MHGSFNNFFLDNWDHLIIYLYKRWQSSDNRVLKNLLYVFKECGVEELDMQRIWLDVFKE